MFPNFKILGLTVILLLSLSASTLNAQSSLAIFPQEFSGECEGQQDRYFNHCADQWYVFMRAFSAAEDAEKVLLIVYGTDDCEKCAALITLLRQDDGEMGEFVRENFVLVALASERATNAQDILADLNAHYFYDFEDPFVFIVNDLRYFDGKILPDGGFPALTENRDDWLDMQSLFDQIVVRHWMAKH